MRKNMPLVISLIGALFILSILPLPVNALTPNQVFDKVKNSIVVVRTLDAQGKVKSFRSGVLISSGRVATNCQVVKGGITYHIGWRERFVRATLYAEDRNKDICIFNAKGLKGKPAQLGKAANLKVGEPVYAVGAPQGLKLFIFDGIVAQLRGGPPPLIQTTAAIPPGSRGGGLFDKEGRLVGLTTLYREGGRSLNFAMPVEWIGDVTPGRKQVKTERSQTEWLKRKIFLEESKDWQGMLDWCEKWTKSEPGNFEAWFCLGNAYGSRNLYDDAIKAYRQALRIDPENAIAWYNLGGAAFKNLNRYDDAIEAYLQALRIDPEYADAWNNLGLAYKNLNRYDDAIEAYRQALRINPAADTWSNLGGAYDNLKRYDDAIEAYRQALRIDPNMVYTWYYLGNTYGKLNRYEDAIEACRQALRIDPKCAVAWSTLAISYAFSGNGKAALEAVNELKLISPEAGDRIYKMLSPLLNGK